MCWVLFYGNSLRWEAGSNARHELTHILFPFIFDPDCEGEAWSWAAWRQVWSWKCRERFGGIVGKIDGLIGLTLQEQEGLWSLLKCLFPSVSFLCKDSSWLVSHNGSSGWANRSYQRAWSTFTLRTLVDTFSFGRQEAVKLCPSANSFFDTRPNEETLCKSTHTTTARRTRSH